MPAIEGGVAPYRVTVGGLSGTGLVAAPFTGILTGVPSSASTTREITYQVTDALGASASMCCIIEVADGGGPPRVDRTRDGSVGQTYSLSHGSAQWTRTTLGADKTTTDIAGAVGSTYVATEGDIGTTIGARTSDGVVTALGPVFEAPILLDGFDDMDGRRINEKNATMSLSPPLVAGGAALTLSQVEGGNGTAIADRVVSGIDPSRLDVVVAAVRYESFNLNAWECGYRRGGVSIGPSAIIGNGNPPRGLRYVAAAVSESDGVPAGVGEGLVRARSLARNKALPADVSFDALMGRARGRPTVVFTFDDGHRAPLVLALPALDRYGAKATFYPPSGTLRAAIGGTGRLARSDLSALVAAGHHVGCDTSTDAPYTSFGGGTRAGAVAEWRSEAAKLKDLGVPDDHLRHICYPNGLFQRKTRRSVVSEATFDGTRTVAISEAPKVPLVEGMTVRGWNVPAGTTLASIAGDQSSAELTQPVPPQTIAFEAIDENDEFFDRRLIDDLLAAGVRTARATVAIDPPRMHTRFGFGDMACALSAQSMTNKGFPDLKRLIDDAVAHGTTNIVYIHDLLPAGRKQGINVFASDLVEAIHYAGALVDAGTLDILSIKQLWERDGASGLPF